MIFIISIRGDTSTNRVIAHLKAAHAQYCRINFDDFFNRHIDVVINISTNTKELIVGKQYFNEEEIARSVVWCRKLASMGNIENSAKLQQVMGGIYNHINDEYIAFVNSFMCVLNDAYWLCHHNAQYLNKVDALICARKCGLDIPHSVITNNKEQLRRCQTPKMITKCLGDGLNIKLKDTMYLLSTTTMNNDQLESLPNYFMPSMTQAYIEKYVELRIFYIEGEFFATAIFSQESPNTKIDFRIITENEKHCRMTPYNLPIGVKEKLKRLMGMLNLNTGSIDMICTPDSHYYFLEVNPAGQYGWVAQNCNYPIDKYISDHLQQIAHERNSINNG